MIEKNIMERSVYKYDFCDLNIRLSDILKVLGYADEKADRAIIEMIKKVLEDASGICKARAEYNVYDLPDFGSDGKSIRINDIDFMTERIVSGQLKKSESIAVFLCTAGPLIGERSRRVMKEGDLFTGYLYDIIGSEIVDSVADKMQNDLKESLLSAGKKITNRYSPGYCDWDVSEQHKLFQLMPDNFCKIKLNSSALMDPEKSISGFIGIGMNVEFNEYTCGLCDMNNCIFRKLRQ